MAANILLLSTEYTGHGHKSIAEALCQQFDKYSSTIKIHLIEAFKIGGPSVYLLGKIYSPLTTHARPIWKAYYNACHNRPSYMNAISVLKIRKKLLSLISEINPDMIVTLHAGYVGSVLDVLEENNINIPVIVQVADLVSLTSLWADKRAQFTICPTIEAKERLLQFGVPENRIKVLGFPIRQQFCNSSVTLPGVTPRLDKKLRFLLINGCEKTSRVIKIVETLLNKYDCQVTVIAGRNMKLEKRLKEAFHPSAADRVNILGYITNLQDYMSSHDILFTKAGPNILMEAVNCCIPVIITGFLPGQEEENPDFIVNHGLGIVCENMEAISSVLDELIYDNRKKLMDIQKNQYNFRDLKASENITDFIVEQIRKNK